jgi:hypothetical protein
VKSVVARKAKAEKPKEPLTYEHLVKIAADEKAGSFVDIRDTFMVVLLMAGMLRESEEMNHSDQHRRKFERVSGRSVQAKARPKSWPTPRPTAESKPG